MVSRAQYAVIKAQLEGQLTIQKGIHLTGKRRKPTRTRSRTIWLTTTEFFAAQAGDRAAGRKGRHIRLQGRGATAPDAGIGSEGQGDRQGI